MKKYKSTFCHKKISVLSLAKMASFSVCLLFLPIFIEMLIEIWNNSEMLLVNGKSVFYLLITAFAQND